MATETITIPLTNGKVKGSDFVSNKEDTQYVTFEDGGNLTNVKIEKFGKGTPTEAGTFVLQVTVYDSTNETASAQLSLYVAAP